MKLPQKCHECCKLRTGIIITGVWGVLFTFGITISYWLGLVDLDMEECENLKYVINHSYVYIITSALLIYGAVKKSRFIMLPWLLYVYFLFAALVVQSFYRRWYQTNVCMIFILMFGEIWYVSFCVLSYLKEIAEPKTTITSVSGDPTLTQPATTTSVLTCELQPNADVGKDPVNV